MKDIFTDLYKKVVGFFQSSQTTKEENAKDVACNRLKLVLMQDRTNLTPLVLERMRKEMIELLSKYVEMDQEALELNFEQEGEQMALMLSIPVLRAKEEDEIQAIIEAEEKAKAEAESEEESEEAGDEENTEETESEAEEAQAEDATETVDAEMEEAEAEEICGCGCGSSNCECDNDGNCACSELDEADTEEEIEVSEENVEENIEEKTPSSNSSKKSKKNK